MTSTLSSLDLEFWLSWTVQCAAAIGTVGAVAVALFGERLREWIWPTKLTLLIAEPNGELTEHRAPNFPERPGPRARYWHLRLSNSSNSRTRIARSMRLDLAALALPGPDGRFTTCWHGSIPVPCKYQVCRPLEHDVGPPVDFDIFCVYLVNSVPTLKLLPMVQPTNLQSSFTGRTSIELTFQALGPEHIGEQHRVTIAWDGLWSEATSDMAGHLTVTVRCDKAA